MIMMMEYTSCCYFQREDTILSKVWNKYTSTTPQEEKEAEGKKEKVSSVLFWTVCYHCCRA